MVGRPIRQRVLETVAGRVPTSPNDDCVRVGIDGVDGAGKTMFADELAAVLREQGRPVVRIGVDGFHHLRAIRYRRGRFSPEGFWRDTYDYERLRTDVLEPLGPGGSRRYRPVAHDVRTDAVLSPAPRTAPAGAVLILDGLFLHRDELRELWDLSVLLDVPFEVSVPRMADRDGTSGDPEDTLVRRYVEGQRLYFAACDPRTRADIVVDNSSIERPEIL